MLGLALRNASRGVGVGPFAGNDPVGVVENRAGLRPWIAPVDSIKNPIRVIEWIGLGWVVGSAPGAGPILGLHVSRQASPPCNSPDATVRRRNQKLPAPANRGLTLPQPQALWRRM